MKRKRRRKRRRRMMKRRRQFLAFEDVDFILNRRLMNV